MLWFGARTTLTVVFRPGSTQKACIAGGHHIPPTTSGHHSSALGLTRHATEPPDAVEDTKQENALSLRREDGPHIVQAGSPAKKAAD